MPKNIVIPAVQQDPPHDLKMVTEKHDDEKIMQQRLVALALDLVCSEMMVQKNAKDMI